MLPIIRTATAASVAALALSACTTQTFSYKGDNPNAPICKAAEAFARANPEPGTCVRLGWDIDPEFAQTPDEAWRFLCETEPLSPELQDAVCTRTGGGLGARIFSSRSVSEYDKRQELAQLLACGRGEKVMVEDLWRAGHDRYEGDEVLAFDGGDVRARWRGGVPFVGWTYQEILLEAPGTPESEGCGFKSDDLPGAQIERTLNDTAN